MSDEPVILEVFGDPEAALCSDGVCAVPGAVGDGTAEPGVHPDAEAGATEADT